MRKILKKAKEGFTLIELMIVVAIVGILAVLAVYGVRKYIANSKTTEAKNSLGQMSKDAATAYEKEGMSAVVLTQGTSTSVLRSLCDKASAAVPATTPAATKYQSKPSDWNADSGTAGKGFACLKFSMDQPQYYSYNYTASTASNFNATANGDLNGDGVQSTFQISGIITSGVLNIAPNMSETNPEE